MPRTSDYSKQVGKDNLTTNIDIQRICSKINNESITPKELALYLEYKASSEISIDEKTIRINLTKLCENSNGLLDITAFKDEKGKYSIRPEYHGILVALFSNNILDKRKTDLKFTKHLNSIKNIIDSIDNDISSHDKEFIKALPCYKSLLLEERLLHTIGKLFSRIINVLMNAEPTVKISLIARFMQNLNQQLNTLHKESTIATEEKYLFDSHYKEGTPSDVLQQLYFSKTLKDALKLMLVVKMMNIPLASRNQFVFTPEELFILNRRYHVNFDPDKHKDFLDAITEVEKSLGSSPLYTTLVNKISKSLDLNNPKELAAFNLIRIFLEDCIIKTSLSEDSYNKILNFMQESYATDPLEYIAEDLRRFCNI